MLGLIFGAAILSLGLCTVWEMDPWFVALTETPGPAPNAPLSVVEVGPNKCTGKGAEEASLLGSSLLLH